MDGLEPIASMDDMDEEFESWLMYESYACRTVGGGGGGGEFTRQDVASSVFGTNSSPVFWLRVDSVLQQLLLRVMFSVLGTFAGRDELLSSGVFGGFTLIPAFFVVDE
jgi:hypothetical protein